MNPQQPSEGGKSLVETLVNATRPEPGVRVPAENELNFQKDKNFPNYLRLMCQELANPNCPPEGRLTAGLHIKNSLFAKDPIQQNLNLERWKLVPPEIRAGFREAILKTLACPFEESRQVAAQIIAKTARLEIPRGEWVDLPAQLLRFIRDSPDEKLQESAFVALGFVCEEIPNHLQGSSNQVLDAISQGMKAEQKNDGIKAAATKALYNCLHFVKANFNHDQHRSMIFAMVFEAARSGNADIRGTAFQCLVQIAELYYDKIAQFLLDIFKLTHNAIDTDESHAGLQAVEFWCVVAIIESDILDETLEAQEQGKIPPRVSHHCVNKALEHIVPLMLKKMTLQQGPDIDDWDIAKAAAACVQLLAQCARDNIVQYVLPFVQKNINAKDWHLREAATMAFGDILDGPSKDKLAPLVRQAFLLILGHVEDKHICVKDTAAWTVGRICELLPMSIDPEILPNLMNTLLKGMKEPPAVAAHVCWAIHNLAEAVQIQDETSPISGYFEGLVGGLLECADRRDAHQDKLMASAYEAINVLVLSAAPDVQMHIEKLIVTLIERLQKTSAHAGLTGEEAELQNYAQALLGGSITTIIQKLDKAKIEPHADQLMYLFLNVLQSKNATVHEEILMAVGALANCCGPNFEKYMESIKPTLVFSLKNASEHMVCQVGVGVVGDICRALDSKFAKFGDEIVVLLLQNLQNPQLDRSVKPHIISCLGDIAMAIGGDFERYLAFVMMMFCQASQTKFDELDYDNIDYLNQLRETILESYTAIIQALHSGRKADKYLQFVQATMGLVDLVVKDENRDADVVTAACGVIGDMANCLGSQVREAMRQPVVSQLLSIAAGMNDPKVQKSATWANRTIQALQ